MNCHHYLETIDTVLAWDLPEEAFANAIHQQFSYITNPTGDIDTQYLQEFANTQKYPSRHLKLSAKLGRLFSDLTTSTKH